MCVSINFWPLYTFFIQDFIIKVLSFHPLEGPPLTIILFHQMTKYFIFHSMNYHFSSLYSFSKPSIAMLKAIPHFLYFYFLLQVDKSVNIQFQAEMFIVALYNKSLCLIHITCPVLVS